MPPKLDPAARAEALMDSVRKLGHTPHESPSKSFEEQRLAKALRRARADGIMSASQQAELESLATRSAAEAAASTAAEHAQSAEALMERVRKLGHLPKESQSKFQEEQRLGLALRRARATGIMSAYESELRSLDARSAAAEHAQSAEALMDSVRKLGHLPKESQSKSQEEQLLARDIREAKASGLLKAFEEELDEIAAADERRRTIVVATDHKASLEALYYDIDSAVSQNVSLAACRQLAAKLDYFEHHPLLQSTDAQALVTELRWMLGRYRQSRRTEKQKVAAKMKHAKQAARRRSALSAVKATLAQWRAAKDKCNCHEFSCWQDVWRLDPLAATTLRASNHHLPGCHMWRAGSEGDAGFLCSQCGLAFSWRDMSRSGIDEDSLHSSRTNLTEEADCNADGFIHRFEPNPCFTHGHKLFEYDWRSDSDSDEPHLFREVAPLVKCTCLHKRSVRFSGFRTCGIKSTCSHCSSTIETGVLYGGYDPDRQRFYFKELTFHHHLGECDLPGPFPGRFSRQWMAAIDGPILSIPGGIGHQAYRQLMNHCGATADYMLHRYRFGMSGRLLCGKPTISTLLQKAPHAGSEYSIFNRFPGISSPLKLEPNFQLNDTDVRTSWAKLQLDLVDEISPEVLTKILIQAKAALGRYPQVRFGPFPNGGTYVQYGDKGFHRASLHGAHRTETRVALLWQIWRSRRSDASYLDVLNSIEESLKDADGCVPKSELDKLDAYFGVDGKDGGVNSANTDPTRRRVLNSWCRWRRELSRELAAEQPDEKLILVWARDVEAVLETYGLNIKGVDASRVFFHVPSKPMSVERQKQALIRAGVYHALDICWGSSCYAPNPCKACWWVPREWFKHHLPLVASIADRDAIAIPGHRLARRGSDGIWEELREGKKIDPWKGFFVTHADFDAYNRKGMRAEDPNAHRWSSAKLLFDYTPYATTSDWREALDQNRWRWRERNAESARRKERYSRKDDIFLEWYGKDSDIWKHFEPKGRSEDPPPLPAPRSNPDYVSGVDLSTGSFISVAEPEPMNDADAFADESSTDRPIPAAS